MRTKVAGIVGGILMLCFIQTFSSPVAIALTGVKVSPMECFGSDPTNYVWENQPVSGGTKYYLRCGAGVDGVTHIDQEHEITPENQQDFVACVDTATRRAILTGPGNFPGSEVWKMGIPATGAEAVIVLDKTKGFMVTLYTTGTISNDWFNCAHAA